jgi:anti-anti-sigma regulatory factor
MPRFQQLTNGQLTASFERTAVSCGVGMLKIQRKVNGSILFTLSGRIETADTDELRRLLELESAGSPIALDLKDVTLVDRDAIKFLIDCKAGGIKLENCPPYIREWIERERGRPRRKDK